MMVGSSGGGSKEPDWTIDQALAQIQQLMNSLTTLQNMVQQQSAIIQQLQNQAPVGQPGVTPRGPKMATPPFYDGLMTTLFMQTEEYWTEFLQAAPGTDPMEILYQNIYQAFGDPNKQATAILVSRG
ncbi:hypothetical protein AMATHDRAFT_9553 [Amanita thiersii Skay4041]|uniref:Uncharacterized protein n=1 Tax=Amanita thiersii Skay4041 TaxID=703135 RepID=A0A2A9NC31_9AGAR|nr:hypothetical protein AMATHDRAFT_9553 [Amanita thiersii Skay4041]